jgi:tetratricopeptide (TPR) repeat protein
LLGVLLLALAGCTTAPAPVTDIPVDSGAGEAPVVHTQPVEEPVEEEARTFALPEELPPADGAAGAGSTQGDTDVPPTPPPAPMNSPAVLALLEQAQAQASSGDAEQAAATLERALRIEPRNPWLWHRLAVLRMQQGRYEQAIEFATRSSSLANGDPQLLSGNQQVIDRCRTALKATEKI